MESDSSVQSNIDTSTSPEVVKQQSRRFSASQAATLNAYYRAGMKSEAVSCMPMITRCSYETKLDIVKIKRWIKKKNYRQKHAKPIVAVQKTKKVSPWQHFMTDFGKSRDGKEAMKQDFKKFSTAASSAYRQLTSVEREALKQRPSQHSLTLNTEASKREGAKIFRTIQKQMVKLEDLKYSGFAFAYLEDDVQFTSTSTATCCCTPQMVEYIRSVIVANNPPPVVHEEQPSSSDVTTAGSQSSPVSSLRKRTSDSKRKCKKVTSETSSSILRRGKGVHKESVSKLPRTSSTKRKEALYKLVPKELSTSISEPLKVASHDEEEMASAHTSSSGEQQRVSEELHVSSSGECEVSKPSNMDSSEKHEVSKLSHTASSGESEVLKEEEGEGEEGSGVAAVLGVAGSGEEEVEVDTECNRSKDKLGYGAVAKTAAVTNLGTETVTMSITPPHSPEHVTIANSSTLPDNSKCKGSKSGSETAKRPSFNEHKTTFNPPSELCQLLVNTENPPEPIVITGDPPDLHPDPNLWLSKFDLYYRDMDVIKSGKWLNDAIINVSQGLLNAQACGKGILGFQNTQLSKSREGFKPIQFSPFIQILHVADCHWVTVSNIDLRTEGGYFSNYAQIYDSNLPSTLPHSTMLKVCSLMKTREREIRFELVNVMRQPNGSDCGIFAIAFATELVHGFDPVLCHWDAAKMRQHLINCLEDGHLSRFPLTKARRIPLGCRVRKSFRKEVYCTCRSIDDPSRQMIECTNCRMWYHKECEKVDLSKSFKGISWNCSVCKSALSTL